MREVVYIAKQKSTRFCEKINKIKQKQINKIFFMRIFVYISVEIVQRNKKP